MNVLERGSQHGTDLQAVLSFVTWSLEKLQLTLAVLCKALYHFPQKKAFVRLADPKAGAQMQLTLRAGPTSGTMLEVKSEPKSFPFLKPWVLMPRQRHPGHDPGMVRKEENGNRVPKIPTR